MTPVPPREPADRLLRFPGGELVADGLADVAAGRVSAHACLVWIAWPRLRRAGLVDDRSLDRRVHDPEMTLYRLLRANRANAYGAYRGLLRRLVSFEHALDRAALSSTPP